MFVIIKEKNSFFRAMNIFFISSKKSKSVTPEAKQSREHPRHLSGKLFLLFVYKKPTNAIFFFWKKYNFENVQKIVGACSTNFLAFFITPW